MKAGSGSGARRNTEPQHHDEKLKLAAALGNQAFASVARSTRQRTLHRFVESEHKLIGDLGSTRGPRWSSRRSSS